MGQSAGAIDVYALLTSPLVVDASPQLFHRAVPTERRHVAGINLPPGSFADAEPGLGLRRRRATRCCSTC